MGNMDRSESSLRHQMDDPKTNEAQAEVLTRLRHLSEELAALESAYSESAHHVDPNCRLSG